MLRQFLDFVMEKSEPPFRQRLQFVSLILVVEAVVCTTVFFATIGMCLFLELNGWLSR